MEEPRATCELCDKHPIRYQFEIENTLNDNRLLVGSECIVQFDIPVVDEAGQRVCADDAARRVRADRRRLIEDARSRSVVRSLLVLAAKDTEFNIENFITYYRENDAFTPNQLSLLVWRFEKYAVEYHRSFFKMKLRRGREQQQLADMEEWKLQRLLPSMSASQRQIASRLRSRT